MSPNGRRAWREWMRKANPRRKLRPPTHTICRLAREGRRHIGPIPPATPKPFSPRSLVGMTMGARKRAWLSGALLNDYLFPGRNSTGAEHDVRSDYCWPEIRVDAPYLGTQLGERLRPCPGCCACWGSDISPAGYGGDVTECFGPLMAGKSKRAIANMKQYQRTLADDCDGSGVLPARNKGVACLHRGGSR